MNQQPSDMQYQSYPDDEIDLMELFAVLWRGKWIVIGVTLISVVIAIGWLSTQVDIYKVESQFENMSRINANQLLIDTELSELSSDLLTDKVFQVEILGKYLPVEVTNKKGVYSVVVESPQQQGVADELNRLVLSASHQAAIQYIQSKVEALELSSASLLYQLKSDFVREAEAEVRADIQKQVVTLRSSAYLLQNNSESNAIKVTKKATDPNVPIKPKRPLVLALSIVLGGMLGVFIVFIRQGMRSYNARQLGSAE
jgi:uncharacterized protein involved in exopolysaccharide biosynthesis